MESTLALSALDQYASRGYMHVLYCFSTSSEGDQLKVVEKFQRNFSDFCDKFPVLNGDVCPTGSRGYLHVKYNQGGPSPSFSVEDVQSALPPYEVLRKRKFPIQGPSFRILKKGAKTPHKPVMRVKVNLLAGGLILCISMNHSFSDATGMVHLIRAFASFCAGTEESGLARELAQDRPKLLHGVPDSGLEDALTYHGRVYLPPTSHGEEVLPNGLAPEFEKAAVTFEISELSVKALKDQLTVVKSSDIPGAFISSLDAAIALIFASIIRARAPFVSKHSQCSLNIAVNCRNKLKQPIPEYLGHCVAGAVSNVQLAEVVKEEANSQFQVVSDIAFKSRDAIIKVDELLLRRYISMIAMEDDISRAHASCPAPVGPSTDVLSSSWAAQPLQTVDFGQLPGVLDDVRVFTGWSEQLCVQPRNMEYGKGGKVSFSGPIVVTTLVEKACLHALQDDVQLTKWFSIVYEQ